MWCKGLKVNLWPLALKELFLEASSDQIPTNCCMIYIHKTVIDYQNYFKQVNLSIQIKAMLCDSQKYQLVYN